MSSAASDVYKRQGPRPSPLIKLLPLIEAARDYGPQLIDKTFSFVELKQIKADSGNYSNNPNNYIDAFQHLTLAYKLTWKDTIVVLRQTLSDLEQEKVIKEARKITNNLHQSDSKYTIGESVPPVEHE